VNIYSPSGAEPPRKREIFYTVELPYLIRAIPNRTIFGGDFNCVLAQVDCTGKVKFSRETAEAGARLGHSGCVGCETDARSLYALHTTGCDMDRPQIQYQKYQ
jgi:hypothetical protein